MSCLKYLVLAVGLACSTMTLAQTIATAKQNQSQASDSYAFFESKIRPVLIRNCYRCHSAAEGASEGGLLLDSRQALLAGGDRGPALIPGRPDASLLLSAVSHMDDELQMPPKGKILSRQEIADLRKWIESGAPDPRSGPSPSNEKAGNTDDAAMQHWAYQSPKMSAAPSVEDRSWGRDVIDDYVLATLNAQGLTPSSDASADVLLRRLHFDVIGLPPPPAARTRFLEQIKHIGLDRALAGELDRLLASPEFGRRWGRHWLDVARFAESSGGESNISFPHAWRYRDYVIDAINNDVPYDRFLVEQIAGDRLPYESDSERERFLVATGFLAVGSKNLGENNEKQFVADMVDEQIDSLTRAVIASSVACARCHHHKFDPFSMEDYYGLAGIFYSTKTYFGTHTSPANQRSGDPLPLPRVKGQKIYHASIGRKRFSELKDRLSELRSEWSEMEAAKMAAFAGKKPKHTFTLREVLANIWRRGPIEGKLETVDETGTAIPLAMGVLDRPQTGDAPLFARGEITRPGNIVPRGFPKAIDIGRPSIAENQSGRLELAQWLTDPAHPLTSRVFVNRVWHHLFGSGLVTNLDNFGTTGTEPSHPELLDRLSIDFVADDWSLKRLIRRLILSRTWRQSSTFRREAFELDPENRLLWRMPKQRLEAEAIRDAMLFASGELNLERAEASLVARFIGDKPISLIGLDKKLPRDLDGDVHRSVYLPVIRDRLPDILELFDFAEPSLVTGQREQTNVPVQALYLMNSGFVQDRVQALATRLCDHSPERAAQIRYAYLLCFGRNPDPTEIDRGLAFLDSDDSDDHQAVLAQYCQALISTAEFRNLD